MPGISSKAMAAASSPSPFKAPSMTLAQASEGLYLSGKVELEEALDFFICGFLRCADDHNLGYVPRGCVDAVLERFADHVLWGEEGCPWNRLNRDWKRAAMRKIVYAIRDRPSMALDSGSAQHSSPDDQGPSEDESVEDRNSIEREEHEEVVVISSEDDNQGVDDPQGDDPEGDNPEGDDLEDDDPEGDDPEGGELEGDDEPEGDEHDAISIISNDDHNDSDYDDEPAVPTKSAKRKGKAVAAATTVTKKAKLAKFQADSPDESYSDDSEKLNDDPFNSALGKLVPKSVPSALIPRTLIGRTPLPRSRRLCNAPDDDIYELPASMSSSSPTQRRSRLSITARTTAPPMPSSSSSSSPLTSLPSSFAANHALSATRNNNSDRRETRASTRASSVASGSVSSHASTIHNYVMVHAASPSRVTKPKPKPARKKRGSNAKAKVKKQKAAVDAEQKWNFEAVLDSRMKDNDVHYKIKWVGSSKPTWQPSLDLEPEDIGAFHETKPGKPGPPEWYLRGVAKAAQAAQAAKAAEEE